MANQRRRVRPDLILTTSGTDGACSAAMSLTMHPGAELESVSGSRIADALGKVAEKKGADLTALVAGVLAAGGGPASSGTKAQDVKFANPDNFTGTAAKGGIDKGVDGGMAALMNRSKQADVRGAVDTLNVL